MEISGRQLLFYLLEIGGVIENIKEQIDSISSDDIKVRLHAFNTAGLNFYLWK